MERKTPYERAHELIRLLVPDLRPSSAQVLWGIRIAVVVGVLVTVGYAYDKTLWDWLKLLIVPVVIAAGGIWFNRQQQERQRALERQRAQEEALQAYLDQMSQLLTDSELPLSKARPGDDLSTVARARTLTVLTRLDRKGKGSVLQFLYESGLITKNEAVLDLRGADLTKTAVASRVSLKDADLGEVNLREANLNGVDLSGANLQRAHLGGASLFFANLSRANLSKTYLSGADLTSAGLSETDLSQAILGSTVRKFMYFGLPNAPITSLEDPSAVLTDAYLGGANLSGADLSEVDLTRTTVTDEQLYTCQSLEGATMPNGQKYEDWIKDKKAREEGG